MKYLFALPLLALLLAGCQDDDDIRQVIDTTLTVDFRADYGGQPLGIQRETYDYPTGDRLKVLLFQYYVSDLTLVADDGSNVRLSDIDLVRWMSAADSATTERTYTVPAGDYTGLRFGLGVKPELNAQDPSAFAADYVLNEAEFWGPATRYVFAKIEANAELENDDRFDTGLTYHMGSDSLYTEVAFNQPFTVAADGSTQLTVLADVLKALSDNGDTFDIDDPSKQTVHGGNQAVATEIWERLTDQFRLQVGR